LGREWQLLGAVKISSDVTDFPLACVYLGGKNQAQESRNPWNLVVFNMFNCLTTQSLGVPKFDPSASNSKHPLSVLGLEMVHSSTTASKRRDPRSPGISGHPNWSSRKFRVTDSDKMH